VLFTLAFNRPAAMQAADESTDSNNSADSTTKSNPYLPRKGMSVEDLQAYIQRMDDAPETIRNRPGYAEGIAVAAQQLVDTDPKGSLRTFAIVHLLDALHQSADLDDNRADDEKLAALAAKYADDKDKKIASAAAFYSLEQRMLKSDNVDLEKLPALLDEVKTSLTGKPLDAKHQRIASTTVHAINRVKDDEEATKRLKEFGELFAASSDATLSRYGKKIVRSAGLEKQSDWVGKPMELTGTTSEGGKFDIAQYKGKVVLVDFWATWCGPCRAALPDLKEAYEKYHAQGFEVVGVDLDGQLSDLSDFLDKEKLPWVNVVGEEKEGQMQFPLAEKYGINGIPTTFLVGRDGKIVSQTLGAQDLSKQIEKLLAEKANTQAAASAKSQAK
jgi:thiol-disulfide isomerase/thioredoxin